MSENAGTNSIHDVFLHSSQRSVNRNSYTLYLSVILTPFFLYFAYRTVHPITMYLDITMAALCTANAFIVRLGLEKYYNVVPTIAAFVGSTVALYVLYLGTDEGSTMLWIYMAPLLIFVLGGYLGILITFTVMVAGTWLLANASLFGGYDYPSAFVWRFATSYSILAVMMVGFEYWRVNGELERERLSNELVKTAAERDIYANLASVCAWCRKIRNSDQEWLSLETYLQQNDQMVSHSICPECAKREMDK